MRASWNVAITAAVLVGATSITAAAQVTEKKALTLDGARAVIAAAIAAAKTHQAPGGVIAVVDDGGNLVALERLDDTFAAGATISIGKARTAALFKRPTKAFEDIVKNGRVAMVALNDFTPLQGGIPLEVDDRVVGGVGVSGAASAAQDEEIAIAGAGALKAHPQATSGRGADLPVVYFDHDTVAASFAKGAVLFDGGGSYMVHTSRRDGAGKAEVHTKDADIIYVIDGQATLVTGGTVVEGKATAADEIRGREIQGGEPRRIVKGDVMIIPAGTPHWFKDVPGPFTYYVVKAR